MNNHPKRYNTRPSGAPVPSKDKDSDLEDMRSGYSNTNDNTRVKFADQIFGGSNNGNNSQRRNQQQTTTSRRWANHQNQAQSSPYKQ